MTGHRVDPAGGPTRHDVGGTTWWHDGEATAASLATIGRVAGLPAAALDAIADAPQRPHRSRCGRWRLWMLAPVSFRPSSVQVAVGHLVVATDGTTVATCGAPPDTTAERFVADVTRRRGGGPGGAEALVEAILAEVLEAVGRAVAGLDEAVEDVEEAVFAPRRGSHAERIYRLRREVHAARRAVGPLPDLFDAATSATADHDASAPLADVTPALRVQAARLVDQIAHGDALLDSVLAAHQAQVTIQQNDDMRRISAWVAIVAAPTAIASIYGMNFRHMPELGSPYGYPAVLLVMVVVCTTLYRLFRRSGWL